MIQTILVALGAGTASALLHASLASGSAIALLLVQLAPLPLLIAAIGWGHLTGFCAAVLAALLLGLVLGFYYFLVFLFAIGLPAWWLGYLSLLARPVAANGSGTVEWYPIGRLILWAAIIGTAIIAAVVLASATDKASFQTELRNFFESSLRARVRPPEVLDRPDVRRLIDSVIAAIPPTAAVVLTLVNVFNLWLAARIVSVSGRLSRPWPDLTTLALPGLTPGLLAAAIVGSFLPDLAGLLSTVFAASLFMAYAIMGFAVLHAITRGMSSRTIALAGTYAAVVVIGWPILAVSMLGLAESAFNIRARFATKSGPPTPRT